MPFRTLGSVVVSGLFVSVALSAPARAGGFVPYWPTERLEITAGQLGVAFPIVGLSVDAQFSFGRAYFGLTDQSGPDDAPDGLLDRVDLMNVANAPDVSSVRIAPVGSRRVYVTATPTADTAQPSLWDGGVQAFACTLYHLQSPIELNEPVIRLVMDQSSQLLLQGTALGAAGQVQPFSFHRFFGAPDSDIVFSQSADVVVDISHGAVSLTDTVTLSTLRNGLPDADAPINIGPVPALITDNVVWQPAPGETSTIYFSDLTAQDVGVHVIPFTTDLGFGPITRSLRLVVLPEPALASTTLGLLYVTARLRGRRRRSP